MDGAKPDRPAPDDGVSSDEEESEDSEGDQDDDDELLGQEQAEDEYDEEAMEKATIKVKGYRNIVGIAPGKKPKELPKAIASFSSAYTTDLLADHSSIFDITACYLQIQGLARQRAARKTLQHKREDAAAKEVRKRFIRLGLGGHVLIERTCNAMLLTRRCSVCSEVMRDERKSRSEIMLRLLSR